MSAAFPNARASPAKPKSNLLSYMKLRAANDLVVHEKISEWVTIQRLPSQISPTQTSTCRVASALLLQRLVRAFEQRLSTSVDDPKKTKGSSANANGSKSSTSNGTAPKKTNSSKSKQKAPTNLAALMQRKVKVTRLVQQAVQFVGSDVLKVLQVLGPSPTVADVANVCLKILEDVNRIKEFYRIFSIASGKDLLTVNDESSVFFGVFALQALQSLRSQAISSYEFAHDFEYIYRTCYQERNFQACVHVLNPSVIPSPTPTTFAPDTEARNVCWKIARLLALNEDHKNKSDPECKDHRRNHILLSATSIILAANMGKSIANMDLKLAASVVPKQGPIPITEDFVSMVVAPVTTLLGFITKNAMLTTPISPITSIDIRSHFQTTCTMINKLPIMKSAIASVVASPWRSDSILAKAFVPTREHYLLHNYRNIMQALVVETQKNLKINTANQGSTVVNERTGIVNVLLLFPMVIGEPWGIHRDAPMITSRMLCSGENSMPSEPLKDSVAVVMKLKPRPKEIKRKANGAIPEFIRTDTKKAKTHPVTEKPKEPPKKITVEAIDLVGDDSPTPSPRVPIAVEVGEIEAPVINDATELNEWTLSVLSLSIIKPSDTLLSYLAENDKKHDDSNSCLSKVIVPIINRGALRIQSSLRSLSNHGSEVTNTVLTVGKRDGQVYVNGQIDQSIQLCASVVGFYYHSLEAIICDEMERLEFLGSFSSVVRNETFHKALLACCYTCVLKGVGTTQKFAMYKNFKDTTAQVVMNTTESDAFAFLKVIDALGRALADTKESAPKRLGHPIIAGLPVLIKQHIEKLQIQLIDSVVWNNSPPIEKSFQSSLNQSIKTMKSLKGAWPPDVLEPLLPDEIANLESSPSKRTGIRCKPPCASSADANFLSFVLRKLLNSVFIRTTAICAALDLANESTVHTQILVAFRHLLRHHISIFNDRHVDQLLLCSIYGVCRVMKIRPEITFGKIIDAYFTVRGEEQGERACRVIVRHVKLNPPENRGRTGSQVVGNLIVFYNQVYVPIMQKYYVGSKSLKKSAEVYELNRQEREQQRKEKEQFERKKQMFQSRNASERAPKKSNPTPSTPDSRPTNAGRGVGNAKPLGNKKSSSPKATIADASGQNNISSTKTNSSTVDLTGASGKRPALNTTASAVPEPSMPSKKSTPSTMTQEIRVNESQKNQPTKRITEDIGLASVDKTAIPNGSGQKSAESIDSSKPPTFSRAPNSSPEKLSTSFGLKEMHTRKLHATPSGKTMSTVSIEHTAPLTTHTSSNRANGSVSERLNVGTASVGEKAPLSSTRELSPVEKPRSEHIMPMDVDKPEAPFSKVKSPIAPPSQTKAVGDGDRNEKLKETRIVQPNEPLPSEKNVNRALAVTGGTSVEKAASS